MRPATGRKANRNDFLDELRLRYPADDELPRRLSLIDEAGEKYVRMAHLASVGSHAINGVAALHSELLKQTVLRDFYTVAPEKFLNVTNGVTPRRWVVLSNPKLAALITSNFWPWDWAPFVGHGTYVVQPRSVVVLMLPLEAAGTVAPMR